MRRRQQAAREELQPDGEARLAPGARALGAMPAGLMGGNRLAAMLTAALGEDLAALHDIASVERKADLKRAVLLPKYRDYVERLMADGRRHELIGYYLVWCFDAGRMEEGLRVAAWAMRHGQPLPDRFRASVPLFVATQAVAWAEREYNAGHDFEPYLSQALALVEPGGATPDQVRAGIHRLFGLKAERDGDLATAAQELERAFELGAKVKTALEAVRKRLARGGAAPSDDAPQAGAAMAAPGDEGEPA